MFIQMFWPTRTSGCGRRARAGRACTCSRRLERPIEIQIGRLGGPGRTLRLEIELQTGGTKLAARQQPDVTRIGAISLAAISSGARVLAPLKSAARINE